MSNRVAATAAGLLACGLLLAGCAIGPPPSMSGTDSAPDQAAPSHPSPDEGTAEETEPAEPEKVAQEETCDWGSDRIAGSAGSVPSSPGKDLSTVIVGAWQHTHINDGSGFEPLGESDIRYVFPSSTRLLYCQDNQYTQEAETSVDFELDGTSLVLPSSNPGYEVSAWDADTMLWVNNRDGSLYLLKRR